MIPPIPPFIIWNFWKSLDEDNETDHIYSSHNYDYKKSESNDKLGKILSSVFLVVCFCCLVVLFNLLYELTIYRYKDNNFIFHGISRDKAKTELSNGKILRHKFFPSGVWVIQKNDSIYYNNGEVRSVKDFWKKKYPKLRIYNSGWAITDTLKYKLLINEKENDY